MEAKKYHVYFKGEILAGFNLPDVKRNIANLYKNNPGAVDILFSGKLQIIKKDIDYSMAQKYIDAFQVAGARCHLVPVEDQISTKPKEEPAPTAPTLKKPPYSPGEPQTLRKSTQPQREKGIESPAPTKMETPLIMPKGGTVIREEAAPAKIHEPESPGDWQQGEVILGLYEITGFLGEGGMGRVYKVHHRGWNLDLAVKTPRPDMITDAAGKENFIREAETWVNLGLHPYVASCYYVRTLDGLPRVFTEFVDGGSLRDAITQGQLYQGGIQKSLERIVNFAIQFCWGLHYAHEQGLVHQDVKPANVLLTKEGTVKVTDFGLARALARPGGKALPGPGKSSVVSAGGMTEAYCSPEQAQWKPLNQKTDTWSWGVSVLEMFNGGVTWMSGILAAEALESYRQRGPRDPAFPPMPASLADLLKHCFNKNPEMRPQTMLEIANRLKKIYREVSGKVYPLSQPEIGKDLADSLNNRAVSLLDLNRKTEALQCWEKALQLHPHHPEATYNRGLIQWRSADLTDTELLTRMEEVRKSQGRRGAENYRIGMVHLERGDCEAALKSFLEIPGQNPGINPGDIRDAMAWAEQNQEHSRRPLRVFTGHQRELSAVAFNADGRLAISGAWDHTIRLWEVETGQCIRTFTGHSDIVTSVTSAFHRADGDLVISGSYDRTIKLWEADSGSCLQTFLGHSGWVDAATLFYHNGPYVLSGSWDKTIRLWEVGSGRCLRTFQGHAYPVTSIALSPNKQFILSGSHDQTPRLWDLNTGQCLRTFNGHKGSITSVAISQDGKFGLSSSNDRTIKLWQLETGQCLRTFTGHQGEVFSAVFSPGGQWVLSGSEDKTVRLWEMKTGRCLCTFTGHENKVNAVAFSKDGKLALSGGGSLPGQLFQKEDNSLRLWQTAAPPDFYTAPMALSRVRTSEAVRSAQEIYQQHLASAREAFNRQQFSQAAQHLRSARSQPGFERSPEAISLWGSLYPHLSFTHLKNAWEQLSLDSGEVEAVVMDQNRTRVLAGGSYDKTFKMWDINTGKLLRTFKGHTETVFSLAISSDDRWVLSGSWDNTIKLWNIETGECMKTFTGHNLRVTSVEFGPDQSRVLSGSWDKTLKLWDIATGQCLRTFTGHGSWVNSVTFFANGAYALSGSGGLTMDGTFDLTLKLWDLQTGQNLRTFTGHEGFVYSVALTQDNRLALSASEDQTLKLWNLSTGQCLRTYTGHTGPVNSVRISVDGRWAVSASDDKTIKIWDIKTGDCIRTLEGHTDEVKALQLSRDNSYIVSGGKDKTLKLWFPDWEFAVGDRAL